jgi:hypothetical protein
MKTLIAAATAILAGLVLANDYTVAGVILSGLAGMAALSALAGDEDDLRSNYEPRYNQR